MIKGTNFEPKVVDVTSEPKEIGKTGFVVSDESFTF